MSDGGKRRERGRNIWREKLKKEEGGGENKEEIRKRREEEKEGKWRREDGG